MILALVFFSLLENHRPTSQVTGISIISFKMRLFIVVVHLMLEHSKSDAAVAGQSKSFKAIRSDNLTSLCAIDAPTEVIKVEDLSLPTMNIVSPLPESLCSWRCTRNSNCTGYNWKPCVNACEFYSYVPKIYELISGCTYYGVSAVLKNNHMHQVCQVTSFRISQSIAFKEIMSYHCYKLR